MDHQTLTTKTIKELHALADRVNLYGYKSLKKAELITKIINRIEANNRIEEQERIIKEKEALHSASRIYEGVEKRIQENVNDLINSLEYPYEFLRSGEYRNTPDPIPGQPDEDVGKFPDNVKRYFWIYPGANDEEPWMTLCQLTNDVYVFYKGECDYTGFDCQGSMKLYASKNPEVLIRYGMCSTDYEKYIKDTILIN